jgi:O-antigen/teichoic acid export membrane protein
MVGLQKYGLLNAFVALIFNIGANLLLVSRFGAGGAAMSVTISIYILHGLDFNLAAKRAIVLSHMNSLKWLFIIYLSMAVSGYFYINYWIRK